jgi:subtilisin family serine protease
MADLDTEFATLLVQKDYFERNPAEGRLAFNADEPLYVAVKFTGDVAALKGAGLKVVDVAAGFAFGETNLAGLAALARLPQVAAIQKQRKHHLGLDDSVPEMKADEVCVETSGEFIGYTGADVIVGVIDSGIDFRHGVFRGTNGKTRIHKIWDQTLTAQAGETVPGPITRPSLLNTPGTPIPLGYGVEYNAGQIDAAIEGASSGIRARHQDVNGHGTHVAGIAAGDGSQSGGCHLGFHYVGVAAEATLIVVRRWGLSIGDSSAPPTGGNVLLDAVRYILNEAQALGKAVVINISLWDFAGLMDGTDAEAVVIDRLLTNNSTGTAVVIIAGNAGAEQWHAAATVPAGPTATLELKFKMIAGDTKTRNLVIRYSGSNLRMQLTSPVSGTGGVIDWVSSGENINSFLANGPNGLVTVNNAPNRIDIQIRPAAAPPSGPTPANVSGTWKLEFQDTGTTATPLDALCLHGVNDKFAPYFLNHFTSRSTLSGLGAGTESITVGSYRLSGIFRGRKLSGFSSRGPTTDSLSRVKPEVCAPGEEITSAGLSRDRGGCKRCCCQCCQDFYVDKDGTSMSAPHVAGVVALMLHKNPNLTHTQIRSLLTANCEAKPADSSSDEDAGWGSGRVDAKKVVDAVAQVNPPVAKVAVAPAPLDVLHRTLLETERGPVLDQLFHVHSEEVWELIQKNRRVATIWHRCRGPVWVRYALKAAHAPESPVPLESGGLRFMEALARFAQALKRFGSETLRRDVQAWETEVALVREGMSLQEIIRAIGNRSGALRPATN